MMLFVHRHSSPTLLFIIFLDYIIALELVELRIPTHLLLGTRAMLLCRWMLGPSDVLYSVKWYKDGKEFFRYVPRDEELSRKFLLPGVDVEDFNSSGSNLTLASAILETGGRYRCEVSGEWPRFHTVSGHADMLIIAVPTQGPSISGLNSRYNIGDYVTATCTSGQSRPATQLTWYINGEPSIDVLRPTYKENNGLKTTNLGLKFRIGQQHSLGELKLKCLATLFSIYWRSTEVRAVVSRGDLRGILEESIGNVYSTNGTGMGRGHIGRDVSYHYYIFIIVYFLLVL